MSKRIFNPDSKFIPVDFQIARLLNYDKMKADGIELKSWGTPIIVDEENKFSTDIDQCFMSSGSNAEGIWNLIDQYNEDFEEDDIVIKEVENPSFTDAQKLGARAFFMALVHFLGNENDYEQARNKVNELFSQPHLEKDPNNNYDWYSENE